MAWLMRFRFSGFSAALPPCSVGEFSHVGLCFCQDKSLPVSLVQRGAGQIPIWDVCARDVNEPPMQDCCVEGIINKGFALPPKRASFVSCQPLGMRRPLWGTKNSVGRSNSFMDGMKEPPSSQSRICILLPATILRQHRYPLDR
jgi:hypothetical protein